MQEYTGDYFGDFKGDARSLDYSPCVLPGREKSDHEDVGIIT